MTNVHEILEKARAAGQRLAATEGAVLFAGAVRLAAAQGSTLRGRLVQIDDAGGLHLSAFDDQAPETEPGYLAPELLAGDAPRKSDPRAQVYAAGALGYELLTGQRPPAPGKTPGAELSGPLGDIVRMALAPDRRERFGDVNQLHDAVEGVQPRPPAEGERNIFSALRARWTRVPPEKEAVARLIEKLHQLETQVAQIGKAQGKIEAGQRQISEWIDRFEDGQRRTGDAAARRRPSVIAPALVAGLFGAVVVVVAAGWAMGLIGNSRLRLGREEPAPQQVARPVPEPETMPERPAPQPHADAGASAAEKPGSDAGAVAVAAATEDGGVASAASGSDAGTALAAAPPEPAKTEPTAPPPARPPEPKKRRSPELSQAAMLHAVAISQVRRGEAALERGRADEALESFRAALENEPTMALAFRGLGMAYAMQGNDTQALQAYEKYLRLAPGAADRDDIRRSIAELKARGKIGTGEK